MADHWLYKPLKELNPRKLQPRRSIHFLNRLFFTKVLKHRAHRRSDDATDALRDLTEKYARDLAKRSAAEAKHCGRFTVHEPDVIWAHEVLKGVLLEEKDFSLKPLPLAPFKRLINTCGSRSGKKAAERLRELTEAYAHKIAGDATELAWNSKRVTVRKSDVYLIAKKLRTKQ